MIFDFFKDVFSGVLVTMLLSLILLFKPSLLRLSKRYRNAFAVKLAKGKPYGIYKYSHIIICILTLLLLVLSIYLNGKLQNVVEEFELETKVVDKLYQDLKEKPYLEKDVKNERDSLRLYFKEENNINNKSRINIILEDKEKIFVLNYYNFVFKMIIKGSIIIIWILFAIYTYFNVDEYHLSKSLSDFEYKLNSKRNILKIEDISEIQWEWSQMKSYEDYKAIMKKLE